jgi:GTP cyclohydrolase I
MQIEENSLHDTQGQLDKRQIAIDRVGVKNLRYPVRVLDKAHEAQSTIATVQMTVDLPHHYKGTHMSRFVEVLNAFGPVLQVKTIPRMLRELQERLNSNAAHLVFEFPYFLEKTAPVTGAKGLLDYNVIFDASLYGERLDFVTTAIVPVTTLCPCSKAISSVGAHNQRGQVTFAVRAQPFLWIEDMIRMVEDSASCELFSLLKRPDEKEVTERAYHNPVFVEDLVRNVAERANAHPAISWYCVEAENFESIHNHNAYARIEKKTTRFDGATSE